MRVHLPKPSTVGALCQILGHGQHEHEEKKILSIASILSAQEHDLTFIRDNIAKAQIKSCRAGVCLIDPKLSHLVPSGTIVVETKNAAYDFYAFAGQLIPPEEDFIPDASALISKEARIGHNVRIGHGSLVYPGCQIDDDVVIGHYCVLGHGVKIGKKCRIGHSVSLHHCEVQAEGIISDGSRIGVRGFGFVTAPNGQNVPIPHYGKVMIGQNVDIGAGVVIERGNIQNTTIGSGTRIAGMVYIAHNVTIGKNCIIVSQTGMAGSSTLGERSILAGQVGVADHVNIGADCVVLAKSGVIAHIERGSKVFGHPARDSRTFFRQLSVLKRLTNKTLRLR